MKTFNDLMILGRTEPTVHAYLTHFEMGDMSKEEALISMVMTLAKQNREAVDKYMKHMERCTTPPLNLRLRPQSTE